LQYFGVDDDEVQQAEEGILGVESLAGLEASAKQMARAAMQSAGFDDVSQLQDAIRNGAMKLGDYLQRFQ
jgi:ADP-ribosylation factor GTPase-activating protein 2/3